MEKIVENFFIWRTDLKRLNDLITPSSSSQVQTEIIQRTVGSHLNRTFPVFSEFNLRFCKHVIRLLENCNCEVQDEFYELIQQTLLISEKSESFKSYFLGSQTISLLEKPELISDGTTGLNTWTAGIHLTKWISSQPRTWLDGARVVELGAGAGITAIFTIKQFENVEEYIATDCHPLVLKNMSRNIELNLNREKKSRSVKYKVLNLDWESDEETRFAPDIVLGADIVFDPSLVPSLVSTISKLLREKNGTAFISSTVRNEETYKVFLENLEQRSLRWSRISYESSDPVQILKINVES